MTNYSIQEDESVIPPPDSYRKKLEDYLKEIASNDDSKKVDSEIEEEQRTKRHTEESELF